MAVRLKTHWFQEGRKRGPEQQASVMAAAIWKTATNGLDGLRKAKFAVDVGPPYIAVLTEFLLFLISTVDRLAYRHGETVAADSEFAGEWRQGFTVALARRLADIYRENLEHLVGPFAADRDPGGDGNDAPNSYAQVFIALLNRRMAEYGDFGFDDEGPDFAFMRYFGTCIEGALPDFDDRKWVLDQVMAVQAPEAIKTVARGMRGVTGVDVRKPRRPSASGD